jgi:hypothetical protein
MAAAPAPRYTAATEDTLATEPWRGPASEVCDGGALVAEQLADEAFLAANAGRPYFFKDGKYDVRT